jgi:hypothetical protein
MLPRRPKASASPADSTYETLRVEVALLEQELFLMLVEELVDFTTLVMGGLDNDDDNLVRSSMVRAWRATSEHTRQW